MRAAWYEKQGPAAEVLTVGEMPDPVPGPGEVRIRIAASGINPGDVKKRRDEYGYGMSYPRVIPHSDGAGHIDLVGAGVPTEWLGQRVWCYGAQSYRPFGSAAEWTVVPVGQAVPLPEGIPMEQGACLGIPGITAYQCVHAGGPVAGRTVFVHGAAGAVGLCAVQLAHRAGARVIASVRSARDEAAVRRAGADEVVATAPKRVDHIITPAFDATIAADTELLAQGGSIATYATGAAAPSIPFWPLVFQNARVFFLGSDDFPPEVKAAAAKELSDALAAGWEGFDIAQRFALADIAQAHERMEQPGRRGRVVLSI